MDTAQVLGWHCAQDRQTLCHENLLENLSGVDTNTLSSPAKGPPSILFGPLLSEKEPVTLDKGNVLCSKPACLYPILLSSSHLCPPRGDREEAWGSQETSDSRGCRSLGKTQDKIQHRQQGLRHWDSLNSHDDLIIESDWGCK